MDTTVTGYQGGRWQNGQFYYNRSVNNVNVTNIHNVYNTTVINNTTHQPRQLQRRQWWNQRPSHSSARVGGTREAHPARGRSNAT